MASTTALVLLAPLLLKSSVLLNCPVGLDAAATKEARQIGAKV
jgi:hypothetical protein